MSELKIGRIVMGEVSTNCYFVYREGENKALFFDPADEGATLFQTLKKNGLEIGAILLTHGHFDHIWGAQELRAKSGAKIYALDAEKELLLDTGMNVSGAVGRPCTVRCNEYFTDGQEVELCGMKFKVLATPGHTGGSCCYYFEEGGFVVSGDTLFQESVGRTDFPTGSMSNLVRSIKEKLLTLPEDTVIYPGHGPSTTVSSERMYNPFLA